MTTSPETTAPGFTETKSSSDRVVPDRRVGIEDARAVRAHVRRHLHAGADHRTIADRRADHEHGGRVHDRRRASVREARRRCAHGRLERRRRSGTRPGSRSRAIRRRRGERCPELPGARARGRTARRRPLRAAPTEPRRGSPPRRRPGPRGRSRPRRSDDEASGAADAAELRHGDVAFGGDAARRSTPTTVSTRMRASSSRLRSSTYCTSSRSSPPRPARCGR